MHVQSCCLANPNVMPFCRSLATMIAIAWQGSNLTFELNSHMASTCSGFTSHNRVSTSLGTSVQHKMKKMSKILLLSNVNKNCILSCMFSYNTIINFTELYKQEPNSTCAVLQFKLQYLVCFNIVCEPWKVFQPSPFKFSFWWRFTCRPAASSRIIVCFL